MPQSKTSNDNMYPSPPIPAHKFAGPYTSPHFLSLPASTDIYSRYAHLNCSFLSPALRHGQHTTTSTTGAQAPTLVDLKRHVQSLSNLIVDLTAWEGPIDSSFDAQHKDNNAFDWLENLRASVPYATYSPSQRNENGEQASIEPWQSKPLTSILNRYWEMPEVSAEERKMREGKDKEQLPPVEMPCPLARGYSGPDDIGTIVAHANAVFEELEERLVDKGGILTLFPVGSDGDWEGLGGDEDDEEEEEEGETEGDVKMGEARPAHLKFKRAPTSRSAFEAARNTIFGQYLSYTSALAHRVTALEKELEAAKLALAGEACVPYVLANGVIPTPGSHNSQESIRTVGGGSIPTFRPLLSSQDRYVLANLSPELDARISARLSHDSRARSAAERESHERVRPGRTRKDYVPAAPEPKGEPDRQYRSGDGKSEHTSPPPPPPTTPIRPSAATSGTVPGSVPRSTKRRRSVEDELVSDDDEEDEEDEEFDSDSTPPSSSTPSEASLTSPFRTMDIDTHTNNSNSSIPSSSSSSSSTTSASSDLDKDPDDTTLPSSSSKPLKPISWVDIPARAYRVQDNSKTIFIVLGEGMGPENVVGKGVCWGQEVPGWKEKGKRRERKVGVGREELVEGFRRWGREGSGSGKGNAKGKRRDGVIPISTTRTKVPLMRRPGNG